MLSPAFLFSGVPSLSSSSLFVPSESLDSNGMVSTLPPSNIRLCISFPTFSGENLLFFFSSTLETGDLLFLLSFLGNTTGEKSLMLTSFHLEYLAMLNSDGVPYRNFSLTTFFLHSVHLMVKNFFRFFKFSEWKILDR